MPGGVQPWTAPRTITYGTYKSPYGPKYVSTSLSNNDIAELYEIGSRQMHILRIRANDWH